MDKQYWRWLEQLVTCILIVLVAFICYKAGQDNLDIDQGYQLTRIVQKCDEGMVLCPNATYINPKGFTVFFNTNIEDSPANGPFHCIFSSNIYKITKQEIQQGTNGSWICRRINT